MIDLEMLKKLKESHPDSVMIDEKNKVVTLIGWHIEQFGVAKDKQGD